MFEARDMRKIVIAGAAALWLSPVVAQTAVESCANPVTQSEMNICSMELWQQADGELNSAYKAALARAKIWDEELPRELKGAEESLRTAQRAWITFRDAACEVEGFPMRGGSAEPLLVNGCLTRLTEERSRALRTLVATEE